MYTANRNWACRRATVATACLLALATASRVWGDWLPAERVRPGCSGQCEPTESNQSAIAVASDGRVHVAWVDDRNSLPDEETNDVYYRRYMPGVGWRGEIPLTSREPVEEDGQPKQPVSEGFLKARAGVVIDSENNVYVSFEDRTRQRPYVVRIDGESGTAGPPVVLGTGGLLSTNPSLAVDESKRVHAVWVGMAEDWPQIFYSVLEPGGVWGNEERLTNYASDKRRPTLALDPSGAVHVVWEDNSCGGMPETETNYFVICYTRKVNGADWESVMALSGRVGSFDSEQPHIVADFIGDLHVVWEAGPPELEAENSEIYYRRYDVGLEQWSLEQRITESSGFSSSPRLAVDSSRQIHLLWQEESDVQTDQYDLFYKRRTTTDDWAERVLVARTGQRGSIVVGADSRLHVAYQVLTEERRHEIRYRENDPDLQTERSVREVMLVVDTSGSMARSEDGAAAPPAGESRLDRAQWALTNFLDRFDLYNAPQDAWFGLVSFPNPEGEGHCRLPPAFVIERQRLNADNRDAAMHLIGELGVAGMGAPTPLVEGLTTADDKLSEMTTAEKGIVLLVTDGRHNCPRTYFPGHFPEGLQHPVYVAGIGTTAEVDPRLQDIADDTEGDYVNATIETDATVMSWAKDIIVEVMGLQAESDPPGQIRAAETPSYGAWITDHDTNIAFGLSWVTPGKDRIGFRLRTPHDGLITPADAARLAGVTHLSRPTYQIYYLSEDFLKGIERAGEWTLELSGRQLDRGEIETYQYDVTMASSLKMLPEFTRRGYRTGEEIGLQVVVLEFGRRLRAQVHVNVYTPEQGLGNWFAAKPNGAVRTLDVGAEKTPDDSTELVRRARRIRQTQGEFPRAKMTRKVQLMDDGTQGDLSPDDGIYTGVFRDIRIPGTYTFEILATGETSNGQPFRRHRLVQRHVAVNVQRPSSEFAMVNVGGEQYEVTLMPMDRWGNHLGPGHADRINFVIEGARSLAAVKDHLDGRYSQRFALAESDVTDCTPVRVRVLKKDMTFCGRLAR